MTGWVRHSVDFLASQRLRRPLSAYMPSLERCKPVPNSPSAIALDQRLVRLLGGVCF